MAIKRFLLLLAVLLPSTALAADSEMRQAILSVGTNFVQNGAVTTFSLGGATNPQNDWIEQVMTVPEAATVTKLCYSYGLRTGLPPTYKIGIEGVSATTGRADGVYKTGTGECSLTFTPPNSTADDAHIRCVTITGTTCTVARGDVIAITIRYNAGTVNTTNRSSFATRFANALANYSNQNYLWTVTNSVATRDGGFEHIAAFYGNASRYWGNPATTYLQASYTGTAEHALRFQVPGPAGQTFKLLGAEVFFSAPAAGDTVIIKAYNSASAALSGAAVTIDTDQIGNVSSAVSVRAYFATATQPTLTFNTTYYIGVSWGAANTFLHETQTDATNYFDAWPLGSNTYGATRATQGATAFTDTTNIRPHINPIIDTVVAGAAGGVLTNPGMNGGIND